MIAMGAHAGSPSSQGFWIFETQHCPFLLGSHLCSGLACSTSHVESDACGMCCMSCLELDTVTHALEREKQARHGRQRRGAASPGRRAGSSVDGAEGAPPNGCAPGDAWTPVRAALRYVTHKPWNRIPALTRTFMYNPVLACLAGGRNKARLPSPGKLGTAPSLHVVVPCTCRSHGALLGDSVGRHSAAWNLHPRAHAHLHVQPHPGLPCRGAQQGAPSAGFPDKLRSAPLGVPHAVPLRMHATSAFQGAPLASAMQHVSAACRALPSLDHDSGVRAKRQRIGQGTRMKAEL